MYISELIAKLEEYKNIYGDMEIYIAKESIYIDEDGEEAGRYTDLFISNDINIDNCGVRKLILGAK